MSDMHKIPSFGMQSSLLQKEAGIAKKRREAEDKAAAIRSTARPSSTLYSAR